MNNPIDMNGPWPLALDVVLRAMPRVGPAEIWRFRLERCRPDRAVRVGSWAPDEDAEPVWQRIDWHRLPGRTLLHASLGVLAMRLFGAVEPVPRIVGAPLWNEVSAELTPVVASVPPLSYGLRCCGDFAATLRVRQRAAEPAVCRNVRLERVDADPLLALLRQGLSHVKPGAEPMPQRLPTLRFERGHVAQHAVAAAH